MAFKLHFLDQYHGQFWLNKIYYICEYHQTSKAKQTGKDFRGCIQQKGMKGVNSHKGIIILSLQFV